MPLPTTFAGLSARAEGLFNPKANASANNPFYFSSVNAGSGTYANDIAVDSNGNQYVVGTCPHPSDAAQTAGYIIKYNQYGVVQWAQYLHSGTYSGQILTSKANAISIDSVNNIYVVGQVLTTIADRTASLALAGAIFNYNPSGSVTWQKFYITNAVRSILEFTCVATDPNNAGQNVYAGGRGTGNGGTNTVGFAVGVDSSGTNLFATSISSSVNTSSIAQDVYVNTVVFVNGINPTFGGSVNIGGSSTDGFIVQLDNTGTITAQVKTFNANNGSSYNSVNGLTYKNSYFYVAASIRRTGTPDITGAYAAKLTPSLITVWQNYFQSGYNDSYCQNKGKGIAIDNAGNVFFTGETNTYRATGTPTSAYAFIVTIDEAIGTNNVSNYASYDQPRYSIISTNSVNQFTSGSKIKADSLGNIYIVGANNTATQTLNFIGKLPASTSRNGIYATGPTPTTSLYYTIYSNTPITYPSQFLQNDVSDLGIITGTVVVTGTQGALSYVTYTASPVSTTFSTTTTGLTTTNPSPLVTKFFSVAGGGNGGGGGGDPTVLGGGGGGGGMDIKYGVMTIGTTATEVVGAAGGYTILNDGRGYPMANSSTGMVPGGQGGGGGAGNLGGSGGGGGGASGSSAGGFGTNAQGYAGGSGAAATSGFGASGAGGGRIGIGSSGDTAKGTNATGGLGGLPAKAIDGTFYSGGGGGAVAGPAGTATVTPGAGSIFGAGDGGGYGGNYTGSVLGTNAVANRGGGGGGSYSGAGGIGGSGAIIMGWLTTDYPSAPTITTATYTSGTNAGWSYRILKSSGNITF
jgi:hypothetical protein